MRIPKRILIGQHYYNISKCWLIDWKRDLAGQINYITKELKLLKNTDDKEIEGTFFHEVAHGLLRELEFNYPKITAYRHDEKFVQELGLNLRKTFLDLLNNQEAKK
jgi:hypothetical protein